MSTTLLQNGRVRTLTDEEVHGWLLLDDEQVVATGGAGDVPAADVAVDLDGATVVPAFCDAHVHLSATGIYGRGMDFRGERSTKAILAAFGARADERGILFGGNFEDPLDEPLTARTLDRAVGERPALLARADLHSCVVSTALLGELDIETLEGVDRDDEGQPTGYLRERAAAVAWSWFDSNLSRADQLEALNAAVDLAYSKGISEVHEMYVVEWRGWSSLEVLQEAVAEVSLTVTPYLATDDVERVAKMGLQSIGGDFFLDGSFGSHTAWLSEPYVSSPPPGSTATGIRYRGDEELLDFFSEAQAGGLQAGVHAIGDAAIEQAIATWERVADRFGIEEVRALGHRIEHFECATDTHISRAARLGLRPSVQPAFDRFWGGREGLYAQRIGTERALEMNRFGSMLRAGLELGVGSDSTVTPLDPFLQMASLRAHHDETESVDALEALRLHTRGSRSLARRGPVVAGIQPGCPADLAVLDRDPLEADAEELVTTEVLGTWIAGRRVWPRAEAESR